MNKLILLLFIILFGACQEINQIEKTKNLSNSEAQTYFSSRNIKFIRADLTNLFELNLFDNMLKSESANKEILERYEAIQKKLVEKNNQIIRSPILIKELEKLREMILEELEKNSSNLTWNYDEFEDFIFDGLKILGGYSNKNMDPLTKFLQKKDPSKEEDLIFLNDAGNLLEEIIAIEKFLLFYNEKNKGKLKNKLAKREKLIKSNPTMQTCTRDAMKVLLRGLEKFVQLMERRNLLLSDRDLNYYLRQRAIKFQGILTFLEYILIECLSIKNMKDNYKLEAFKNLDNYKKKVEQYKNNLILPTGDFFNQQIDLYKVMLGAEIDPKAPREINPESSRKILENQIYKNWYSNLKIKIDKIKNAEIRIIKLASLEKFRKELEMLIKNSESKETILTRIKEFEESLEKPFQIPSPVIELFSVFIDLIQI